MHGKAFVDDGALYVSHIVLIPLLLLLLLKTKSSLNGSFSVLLRNLSIGMYLIHRIILSIINLTIDEYISDFITGILVIALSASICLCCYHSKNPRLQALLK